MSNEFPIRINKFLARCGLGSRRSCEALILSGQVRINGQINTDLASQVRQNDSVLVKNKKYQLPGKLVLFAFNKPKNILCSSVSEGGKPSIYDILPRKFSKLHYVGRLDFQSRGLLLLTNNGDLTQKLLNPKNQIVRKYKVKVKPELSKQHKDLLEKGVKIDSKLRSRPAKIILRKNYFEIHLKEGKNREIRKMMGKFHYKVLDLQRQAFGSVNLKDLGEGKMRMIPKSEIDSLISEIKPIN